MSLNSEIDIDIVEDLLCRFIINLPRNEQMTDRIFFHFQGAHWFYLDFYVSNPAYATSGRRGPPHMKLKPFCRILFENCPFLKHNKKQFDIFYKRFNDYISQIPVYGGIILNTSMTKVLLVTNFRNTSYSFPKGKVNQNETGVQCAIREVWEETSIDIANYISENNYIEYKDGDNKLKKMYIIIGVDESVILKTNTRNEIGKIEWIKIADFEDSKKRDMFSNIFPFVKPLKMWIRDYKLTQEREKELRYRMSNAVNNEEVMRRQSPPVDPVLERLNRFERTLNEISTKFESSLQFTPPSVEEKNPFLNFQLNKEELLSAFQMSFE